MRKHKNNDVISTISLFERMIEIAEALPDLAGKDAIIHCCNFYLVRYYKKVAATSLQEAV